MPQDDVLRSYLYDETDCIPIDVAIAQARVLREAELRKATATSRPRTVQKS